MTVRELINLLVDYDPATDVVVYLGKYDWRPIKDHYYVCVEHRPGY